MINKIHYTFKEKNFTENKAIMGHLLALITIIIWGTTFISTKILLKDFIPVEILFFRFVIGFIMLSLIYPYRFKITEKKHEIYFAVAGLCGVTLYFLLENIALTYTLASNVGVIIAISPFFTAVFAYLFIHGEKLRVQFFIGFVIAIFGVFLINFNGNVVLKLNPLGDMLAIFAAIIWAIYSILIKKISGFNYNTVQTTCRIFFYGLLFMIPAVVISHFKFNLDGFTHIVNILNILYLGLGASAICFVTWSLAVKILGAIKTSIYIYVVPVITVITSIIVLHERFTWIALVGTLFTLLGLFISESKVDFKINRKSKK